MTISKDMLNRTRHWLMDRRDGKGGFQSNLHHLHDWSVKQEVVNAYVLWAISEADVATGQPHRTANELGPELDQMTDVAYASNDPYLIGLSAATLMNVHRIEPGDRLLAKLSNLQREDGSLVGETTVTSSGGISRTMETTAIAILAWVKSPRFIPEAGRGAKWITGNRRGNAGFGSTQATVLALKALVAMSGQSKTGTGGMLRVELEGEVIGQAKLPEHASSASAVEIKGLGNPIEAASKRDRPLMITLVAKESQHLSYTVDVAYHVVTPLSGEGCPFELTTELQGDWNDDGSIAAGKTLQVRCRLSNETDQGQPMTVAIIGLPGGLEARSEEMDELQQAGKFDHYEIRNREIVFYWRTIAPNAKHQVDFHVTAAIPGKYTGPASRAYLYYTAEQKDWVTPLKIEIQH